MAEATTSEDWADRQRAQAAGFDAIGIQYDEVFPHKEGQIRTVEQLLERVSAGARVLDLGCGTGVPTARQLVDGGWGPDGPPVERLDEVRGDLGCSPQQLPLHGLESTSTRRYSKSASSKFPDGSPVPIMLKWSPLIDTS